MRTVQAAYVTCKKTDKIKISKGIVSAIRSQNPPGRFLEKDSKTKLWNDIGDKRAVEKTSQALREGQPSVRKQIDSLTSSATSAGEETVGEERKSGVRTVTPNSSLQATDLADAQESITAADITAQLAAYEKSTSLNEDVQKDFHCAEPEIKLTSRVSSSIDPRKLEQFLRSSIGDQLENMVEGHEDYDILPDHSSIVESEGKSFGFRDSTLSILSDFSAMSLVDDKSRLSVVSRQSTKSSARSSIRFSRRISLSDFDCEPISFDNDASPVVVYDAAEDMPNKRNSLSSFTSAEKEKFLNYLNDGNMSKRRNAFTISEFQQRPSILREFMEVD